jgi:hypothetical protein
LRTITQQACTWDYAGVDVVVFHLCNAWSACVGQLMTFPLPDALKESETEGSAFHSSGVYRYWYIVCARSSHGTVSRGAYLRCDVAADGLRMQGVVGPADFTHCCPHILRGFQHFYSSRTQL